MSNNFIETINEKKQQLKKKWQEANAKYPWLKPVLIGLGIAAFGGACYGIYKNSMNSIDNITLGNGDQTNNYAGMIQASATNGDNPTFTPGNRATSEESLKEIWERDYKDNWDEVIECAKRLNLKAGEVFIIEDQKQFLGDPRYPDVDPNRAIVSHMVDDYGVYPPKE